MSNFIVEKIKTKVRNGIKTLLVEVLKGDIQEHSIFTMPGFESVPINGEKVFLIA